MEGRIEPEPALRREFRRHAHVGDEELVVEDLAAEIEAQHRPHRRARAVAGDQPVGRQIVGPVGRLDRERGMVAMVLDCDNAIAPAQIDFGAIPHPVDQMLLDVILLEINEGRHLVAALRQEVESVELVLALEDAATRPAHPLLQHRLRATQPVEDLQALLREADRPAALADPIGVVEQHGRNAALRQIDRERQADGPGADDHHGMMRRLGGILIGRAAVGVLEERLALAHAA